MPTIIYKMTNVYEDDSPAVELWVQDNDGRGSLCIDDAPTVEGGTFNIIVENQDGVPHLHLWTKAEFGNDPLHTINLQTGQWEGLT